MRTSARMVSSPHFTLFFAESISSKTAIMLCSSTGFVIGGFGFGAQTFFCAGCFFLKSSRVVASSCSEKSSFNSTSISSRTICKTSIPACLHRRSVRLFFRGTHGPTKPITSSVRLLWGAGFRSSSICPRQCMESSFNSSSSELSKIEGRFLFMRSRSSSRNASASTLAVGAWGALKETSSLRELDFLRTCSNLFVHKVVRASALGCAFR